MFSVSRSKSRPYASNNTRFEPSCYNVRRETPNNIFTRQMVSGLFFIFFFTLSSNRNTSYINMCIRIARIYRVQCLLLINISARRSSFVFSIIIKRYYYRANIFYVPKLVFVLRGHLCTMQIFVVYVYNSYYVTL